MFNQPADTATVALDRQRRLRRQARDHQVAEQSTDADDRR